MKEKKDGLSSSPKDNEEGFRVLAHRRTSSFSNLAKVYRTSKNEKYRGSSNKLNKSAVETDDTQQLIAVLEHQVSEGDKARREMVLEIAKLKEQLQRADAQIALLKQANSNLYGQLLSKDNFPQPDCLPSRPIDVELCLSGELRHESPDSPCSKASDSSWSDPLNTTIYADNSMHDDSSTEQESDFNINTIINNISANSCNNINNIQVSSINEINYIIDINNINPITNCNNNFHSVNNINTNSNVTMNNFSADSALSTPSTTPSTTPPGTPNTSDSNINSSGPSKTKDDLNTSFSEKEKRSRLFQRTTTNHKRRGSDTESSPKLDEKYQRRHSEGKVLRIAGLREQVRQAVLQILNASYADSEDEWPAVQALLQGVELSDDVLPPPPRHLVHAGFVCEGERIREGYWIDDVLLLLFKDFLLVACQPKSDVIKAKYQFKEVIKLTTTSRYDLKDTPEFLLKIYFRTNSWATDTEHYGIAITTEQCVRSFLMGSKEECDKWISVITKNVTGLTVLNGLQGALRHYLIAPCDGFVVEPTTVVTAGESKLCLEEPRKGIYHYQSFFYAKPHINYVGGSSTCPVAISIEDKTTKFALSPSIILRRNNDALPADAETVTHRALVRTQSGDECVCIAIPANFARSAQTAQAEVLAQLPQALPALSFPTQLKIGATLFRVKSNDLENDMLQYEANNMRRSHKLGVVYCAKGARTETEMLYTTHEKASPDFLQFLSLLGQEVPLKGWADYSGGLDVKNDADGTHSIFTNFWGIPVMFHVSTMLPNDVHNPIVAISISFLFLLLLFYFFKILFPSFFFFFPFYFDVPRRRNDI